MWHLWPYHPPMIWAVIGGWTPATHTEALITRERAKAAAVLNKKSRVPALGWFQTLCSYLWASDLIRFEVYLFKKKILRRSLSRTVQSQRNTVRLPLLVLEQVCLRTGAGWSAFRSVSRFTGVSLTGVAGSEALLPGSLAGSGGDSMLNFRFTV